MNDYKRPESIQGLSTLEVLEFFQWRDYTDFHGHPLTFDADFHGLLEEIKSLRHQNDLLTFRVQSFLLNERAKSHEKLRQAHQGSGTPCHCEK